MSKTEMEIISELNGEFMKNIGIKLFGITALLLVNAAQATEMSCKVTSVLGGNCYGGTTSVMDVLSKNSDGSNPDSTLNFHSAIDPDSESAFGKFYVKTMANLGTPTGDIEKFSFKVESYGETSYLQMNPNPDKNMTGLVTSSMNGELYLKLCGYTGASGKSLPMSIAISCSVK